MIDEIVHIQTTHQDLPISARALISCDAISLRAMTASALTAYLYGARKMVEASRQHRYRETGQQSIQQFFQPRRRIGNEQDNHITAIDTP
jgi:hypothetical protein